MNYELIQIEECPSTQDLAWTAPSPTLPHGAFFIAQRQTAGRGRGPGRIWVSPPGGLYLSWRLDDVDPNGFTLLGGLAVARAARRYGVEARLKWPNDCWVDGRKLAGVLSDCRWSGQTSARLVMGIGVNVCVEELPEGATSLHQHCLDGPGVKDFGRTLIEELVTLLEIHRRQGLPGYLNEVRQLSLKPGTAVRYWQDGAVFEDAVEGLDDQGFLLLASGRRLINADRLEPTS